MGDAHTGLKEYPEAEAAYSNGLCIREYLFSKDPANTRLRHDISWSFGKIAGAKMQTGDFPGALDAAFASLSIRRKLSASDSKNLIWRRDTAAALHQIAEIKAKAKDFSGARMFFLAAAEARLALKKEAPDDAGFAADFGPAWPARRKRWRSGSKLAPRRMSQLPGGGGRGGGARRRQGRRPGARSFRLLGHDPRQPAERQRERRATRGQIAFHTKSGQAVHTSQPVRAAACSAAARTRDRKGTPAFVTGPDNAAGIGGERCK